MRHWLVALASLSACAAPQERGASPSAEITLIDIPGGTFTMGDPNGEPNEAPQERRVESFAIMRYEVTNRQYALFVRETGHQSDPERRGSGLVWNGRWRPVKGADWQHPRGPKTSIHGLDDHPVVQVSSRDAAAFCKHHGLRLPTEAEWEYAARGTDKRVYPWGNNAPRQGADALANFGTVTCCAASDADGYRFTAPIGRFPRGQSPFGVHDMAGNVWEWTADRFLDRPGTVALRGGGWGNNPHCLRVSYRHGNRTDVGRDHVGIRCAR